MKYSERKVSQRILELGRVISKILFSHKTKCKLFREKYTVQEKFDKFDSCF